MLEGLDEEKVAVPLSLSLTTSFRIGHEEPDDVVLDFSGRLLAHVDEDAVEAGTVTFSIVRLNLARELGEDLLDVFDAHDQELTDLYGELFDVESQELRPEVDEQLDGAPLGDLLFISTIEVLPEFRGQDAGVRAAAQIIDLFGSDCGLVVLRPYPLQFDASRRRNASWAKKMNAGSFVTDQKAATKKLVDYWSQLGIIRLGKSRFYGRTLEEAMPWRERGHFRGTEQGAQTPARRPGGWSWGGGPRRRASPVFNLEAR
jgi:hypothetical protein